MEYPLVLLLVAHSMAPFMTTLRSQLIFCDGLPPWEGCRSLLCVPCLCCLLEWDSSPRGFHVLWRDVVLQGVSWEASSSGRGGIHGERKREGQNDIAVWGHFLSGMMLRLVKKK